MQPTINESSTMEKQVVITCADNTKLLFIDSDAHLSDYPKSDTLGEFIYASKQIDFPVKKSWVKVFEHDNHRGGITESFANYQQGLGGITFHCTNKEESFFSLIEVELKKSFSDEQILIPERFTIIILKNEKK